MSDSTFALARNQAIQRGATCIHEYSQSLEPIRSWIGLDDRTKDGVCRRLVIRWFAEVVKPEPKFWTNAVDEKGLPNSAFIGTIMTQMLNPGTLNLNEEGVQPDPRQAPAEALDPLFAEGFKATMNSQGNTLTGKNGAVLAAEQVAKIVPACQKNLDFKFVLFLGLKVSSTTPGGHMIGVAPQGSGPVLIFDPNLGEFSFNDVNTLTAWLTEDLSKFYTQYFALDYIVFKK